MVTCKKKKKKLWKEGSKYETKGERGAVKKKKSGGGPSDLSGAGSRDGCPRLKVLQVPGKKNAPMNVCDLRIRFDRCVHIEFQRKGTRVWSVCCSKIEGPRV